ncbi:MAG: glycosyltransferase [Oceanicaulis sp.]
MAISSFSETSAAAAPCVHAAAFALLDDQPGASAGRALFPPKRLWLGPAVFTAALTAYLPGLVLTAMVAVSASFVAALCLLRLTGALFTPAWSRRARLDDAHLPPVTVIAALYREAGVVAGLMAQLSRLDYPRDRLEVILALEADDAQTIAAARAAARRAGVSTRVLAAPPGGPRTKPRALNYALQVSGGQLIAVYDAEDAPRADQLRAAAEAFAADPGLGVVQAPLGWYNAARNWLTRQFALEYAAQFRALLPAYHRLGLPLPLGGTSNVFRRAALEASGGWDPFNVTEDADLGFRLARFGWRAGLIEPGTDEEAPETVAAWTGQRSRWLKGHAATWLVQMRDVRGLAQSAGWRAVAGLQLSLFANAACALGYPAGLALMLGAAVAAPFAGLSWAGLAALGAGLAAHGAAMACASAGARRAGVRVRACDLAAMPAYWLLQLPAAVRALHELRVRPYVWVKTRHGVSTARREAPHVPDDHASGDAGDGGPVRLRRPARLAPVRSAAPAHDPVDAGGDSDRRVFHPASGAPVRPDGTGAAEPAVALLAPSPARTMTRRPSPAGR